MSTKPSSTQVAHVASVRARIGWKALTAAEYQDEGLAFLATPNIKSEQIDFERVNFITRQRFEESPDLKLEVGDVLLAKDGSTLGIANVVRDLPRPATVNGSIAVIRPHGMESRFMMYALRSGPVQAVVEQVKDGMGVPHLFQADIKRLTLPQPSVEEQRRIADFLDDQVARIDAAVFARRSQAQLAGGSWASSVEAAISPDGVPTTRLGRVARVQSGLTVNARQQADSGGSLVPYLSVSNVKDGYLDLSVVKEVAATFEQVERHRLLDGDVLMTEGGDLDKLGRGTVWEGQVEKCLHQNHVFAVRPDITRLDPWYLTHQTQAGRARRHFMLTASKSTNLASTSASKVLDLPVSLPPIIEQRAIAGHLRALRTTLDGNLAVLEHSIRLLTEYRQSLITAAVSGELDVTTAGKAIGS